MRSIWRIGRIKGIDINIDPSWLIIFGLITFSLGGVYFPREYPRWPHWLHLVTGLITSILFFASVLGHELAHSLVAIRQGEKVRSITLFIFGGAAEITEEPDRPRKEFLVAIVGPLSSLGIALMFMGLWLVLRPINEPASAVARYLAFINIILAIFNLIPGFPMDGGRVLRSIIWGATGNLRRATRIASSIGQMIAFLLIFGGLWQMFSGAFLGGLWFVFIGWFLHHAAVTGYHQVVMRDMLKGIRAEDLMIRDFEKVPSNLNVLLLIDEYILRGRGRAFLVMDNGELEGIVCLDDVKKVPIQERSSTLVKDIMTPKDQLDIVSPEDEGTSVLARLNAKNVHQLPVVENEKVKGMLCRSDIIRYLQMRLELGV